VHPGGKGANQALAARRAGARVALLGAVGRDAMADAALALVRAAGVEIGGIALVDAPTGLALIHVDARGANAITIVPGANALVHAAMLRDRDVDGRTTLVLQLEVPLAEVTRAAQQADARGALVVLTPRRPRPFPTTCSMPSTCWSSTRTKRRPSPAPRRCPLIRWISASPRPTATR